MSILNWLHRLWRPEKLGKNAAMREMLRKAK